MKVALYGAEGKVGSLLGPALVAAGHEVVDGRELGPGGCDVAVDFTRPDAVVGTVRACLEARVPAVIGTTGFDAAEVDRLSLDAGVPCFFAPNFALGAVLMMRFAEEAARVFPQAEIVELHGDTKRDAPSGTAKETARRMGTDPAKSVVDQNLESWELPNMFVVSGAVFPTYFGYNPTNTIEALSFRAGDYITTQVKTGGALAKYM